MKERGSLHQKVQELCDCFAESDTLAEMTHMQNAPATEENALKWLALAVVHGVGNSLREITLKKDKKGVHVTGHAPDAALPAPSDETAAAVIDTLRQITHIDAAKGKSPLAFGFRGDSMTLQVKIKNEEKKQKATIQFE